MDVSVSHVAIPDIKTDLCKNSFYVQPSKTFNNFRRYAFQTTTRLRQSGFPSQFVIPNWNFDLASQEQHNVSLNEDENSNDAAEKPKKVNAGSEGEKPDTKRIYHLENMQNPYSTNKLMTATQIWIQIL
ncbi:unnamed protein product [Allacma fusca]|uniref:Uncharacterized protein n=1 Tax=Allacma fusca TaxID=39272 RepID=A0A8J2K108_9HEXA|nr:unnamed protein product [Allacma fusca]